MTIHTEVTTFISLLIDLAGKATETREVCFHIVKFFEENKTVETLPVIEAALKELTNILKNSNIELPQNYYVFSLRSAYSANTYMQETYNTLLELVRSATKEPERIERVLVGLDNPYT